MTPPCHLIVSSDASRLEEDNLEGVTRWVEANIVKKTKSHAHERVRRVGGTTKSGNEEMRNGNEEIRNGNEVEHGKACTQAKK